MPKPPSIFAICGEFSGESHLARVVSKLKEISADIKITGMGSQLTEKAGMQTFIDYKDYSFAGVTQVLMNLPKILRLKKTIIQKIIELKPELVLMVDYAGFNMQVAKGIRAAQREHPSLKNIKLIQYIAPQIWASRPHRIKNIKENIDHVLYTLPFEKEIYETAKQAANYVGNPVLESLIEESEIDCKTEIQTFLGQKTLEKIIGIFPGSRGFEVSYTLPLFIEAARELHLNHPHLKFIIARAPTISKEKLFKCGLKNAENFIQVIDSESIPNANQKLLKASDYLWLCSGTVTLEAALYEKPYFLTYKANSINFTLYKMLRIINMAGLANIIAGKFIIKEFLQEDATVKNFIEETLKYFNDNAYRDELLDKLKMVKDKLGNYKSSELVAKFLLSYASV